MYKRQIDKSATFFPGIGLLGDFAEIIGDLQKGGRSDVLSDTNRHLVIEIKEEFPAHLPELTEVREKVEKAFKDMKAVEIAKTTAEKLKAKATNFDQFQAAVVELGTTFTKSRPFTRKDVATVLGPVAGFLQDTAGAHKGDVLVNVLGTKAEPTGYVVWHLSQVTEPSKAEFARELFTITREIQTQKESVLLQEFFRKKQKELSAKLKINNPNYD